MIVRFYSDLTNDEKVALNVVGIPGGWPAEVAYIDDNAEVPAGWAAVTNEDLATQKALNQAAYDAWVASRIPPEPTPSDDTSTVQLHTNGNYVPIISRNPRRGSYAVFFNANAQVENVNYRICLEGEASNESERVAYFLIPTETTLSTHAEVYVLDGQAISVELATNNGTAATITKRSMVLIQKDG